MAPRTVLIVVFDGVQSLDVTGPLEVFTGANDHLAARAAPARPTRSPSPGPAGSRSAPPAGSPWSPTPTC